MRGWRSWLQTFPNSFVVQDLWEELRAGEASGVRSSQRSDRDWSSVYKSPRAVCWIKPTALTAGPQRRWDTVSQASVSSDAREIFIVQFTRGVQGHTDALLVPRPKEDITQISHWKTAVETNKWKRQKFNLDSRASWKLRRFHKNKSKNTQEQN